MINEEHDGELGYSWLAKQDGREDRLKARPEMG
jgi:hypothetical protein